MVKAIQDISIDKTAEKKRLLSDKSALSKKSDQSERVPSTDWDELTDIFFEAMCNFFPASWTTFYGDADDENEQWQLWRRFLVRHQVTLQDIEGVCDLLVDRGERFAPNQGIVKQALDEIRYGDSKAEEKNRYLSILKRLYNEHHNQPAKGPTSSDSADQLARLAVRTSGGFAWHMDMHSSGKMEQAFSLWQDCYRHLKSGDSKPYQEKITHPKKNQPCASATDRLMLKHALKNQGPSPELERFAESLGVKLEELGD